jgi:hypothetical protein
MKKIINWVKNLFASKKAKSNETKVAPNSVPEEGSSESIPDPKGKPTKKPR